MFPPSQVSKTNSPGPAGGEHRRQLSGSGIFLFVWCVDSSDFQWSNAVDNYRCSSNLHLLETFEPVCFNLCLDTLTPLKLDRKPLQLFLVSLDSFLYFRALSNNLYEACLLAPLAIDIGLICVINHVEAGQELPRGRIVDEV